MVRNLLWEIHPRCEYIVKERLDDIKERRMATSERGIEVKVTVWKPGYPQGDTPTIRDAVYSRGIPLRVPWLFCIFVPWPIYGFKEDIAEMSITVSDNCADGLSRV